MAKKPKHIAGYVLLEVDLRDDDADEAKSRRELIETMLNEELHGFVDFTPGGDTPKSLANLLITMKCFIREKEPVTTTYGVHPWPRN